MSAAAAEFTGAEVRVYRTRLSDNFTTFHNDLLRNKLPIPLSAVARMLLLYLLSLPEQGWKTDRDRVARDFTEGTSQVRKAYAELTAAGYFRRVRGHEADGQFCWRWEVSDTPIFEVEPVDNDVPAAHTTGRKPTNGRFAAKAQVRPLVENQPVVPVVENQPVVNQPQVSSLIEGTNPTPPYPPQDDLGGGGAQDPAQEAAVTLVCALSGRWELGRKDRATVTPLVADALREGWESAVLLARITENPDGVKYPGPMLASRLRNLPPAPRAAAAEPAFPAWCEHPDCDERTRIVTTADDRAMRCPDCHPRGQRLLAS